MNANNLLIKLQALLGKMKDKVVRDIVESLEDAIGYLQEKTACVIEEYRRLTGKRNLELSNDSRRRLAQRAKSLNDSLLSIIETGYAVNTIRLWYQKLIAEKYDSTGFSIGFASLAIHGSVADDVLPVEGGAAFQGEAVGRRVPVPAPVSLHWRFHR